ncbi:MAG: hypothetical protein OCD03_02775 [Hyphomicrobiales bacterium]
MIIGSANYAQLTNNNLERMVVVHSNSCAEFSSSILQALYTPLKRVFLRSANGRIYGAFTRHLRAPFPVIGLLTCKRLTIIFSRIWLGLKIQAVSMNTQSVSEIQDLITDVQLAAYLVGEQLNALELVLEATISHRADAFSRAIMCQTSNLHCEFKGLEAQMNALNGLGAELRGEV